MMIPLHQKVIKGFKELTLGCVPIGNSSKSENSMNLSEKAIYSKVTDVQPLRDSFNHN